MSDTHALVQTVAVLAVCIAFMAKQSWNLYRSRHNGKRVNGSGEFNISRNERSMLADLHQWHKPIMDADTGQPRFMWYEGTKELRAELELSRKTMGELRETIGRMNDSLSTLVAEIRTQKKEA